MGEAEQLLHQAGLRVTAPRLAVLEDLRARPHSGADAIAERTRRRLGTVSTQAIYDVLHALASAGLIRRIEPAGSAALYETRVADNHHHLICRRCGSVTDLDCPVGLAPCLDAGDTHGFQVDEAEVTFWGTCRHCRTPAAAHQDASHAGHAGDSSDRRSAPGTARRDRGGGSTPRQSTTLHSTRGTEHR